MLVLGHLDFESKSQLKNALLELRTGIAGVSAKGQIFYDSGGGSPTLHAYIHDGVAARKLLQDNDLSANADWTLDTDKLATRATTKLYIDSLVSGVSNFRGVFDASSGAVPTATNIKAGDYWRVTVAGTVTGISPNPKLQVGDVVYASVANATAGTDFFALQANFATATDIQLDTTNAWGGAATDVQAALKELWTKTGGSGGLQYLPLGGTGIPDASRMTGKIEWVDNFGYLLRSSFSTGTNGTAEISAGSLLGSLKSTMTVRPIGANANDESPTGVYNGAGLTVDVNGSIGIWAGNSNTASANASTLGMFYGKDHTTYWNTLTAAQLDPVVPSMKMVKMLIASGGGSLPFLPLAGGTMTGTIVAPLFSTDGKSTMIAETSEYGSAKTKMSMNFDVIGLNYGNWNTSLIDAQDGRGTKIDLIGGTDYGIQMSAFENSGMNIASIWLTKKEMNIRFNDTGGNRALVYTTDYSATWNARSVAIRDRIIPDIGYIKTLIASGSASRQTVTLTGDGVANNFNISHSKGTEPLVQIYDAATNKMIMPEEVTTVNATTLNITFSYAIAAGKVYKVSIF